MKQLLYALVIFLTWLPEGHAQFWAKSNGRFSIGDQDAFAKLQVNGTASFSNPSLAILDSSATNSAGGILQFRSVVWDDNHFNLRARIESAAAGTNSFLDFFWRENLIMSINGGVSTNRHLIYNPQIGAIRTGYHHSGSIGEFSVAMGYNNLASGSGSAALGGGNNATGHNSIALGAANVASGTYAFATGFNTLASEIYAICGGNMSTSLGVASVSMGDSTAAIGNASVALGYKTVAGNHSAVASGYQTDATGLYSFSSGFNTLASATSSSAFGFVSRATGVSSSAFGYNTLAAGENSIALNSITKALGHNSITAGFDTKTIGWGSSAFGDHTTARSYASAVFGAYNDTIATSDPDGWVSTDPLLMVGNGVSNTERHNAFTIYKNGNILAKNPTTVAVNPGVVALPVSGNGTRMMWIPEKSAFRAGTVAGIQWNDLNIGTWSFAAGANTEASGAVSVAMGNNTIASGASSTAFGLVAKASGGVSFATGEYTEASGINSTAMGFYSKATGGYSASIGLETRAKSYASLALGAYNDSISTSSNGVWEPTDPLIMVGNGNSEETRHNTFTIYKNGNLLAKNPTLVTSDPGTVMLPATGSGTRLMWIPEKSAFRAGTADDDSWDADSLGGWSFAAGRNTIASGGYSTALGRNTVAGGVNSIATGISSQAIGNNTTAMGVDTRAVGNNSTAFGQATEALGSRSTAIGLQTVASGEFSTAMGLLTDAIGATSTALGSLTTASGDISTAMGHKTIADAFRSTAVGSYNNSIAGSSATSWIATDPLFYIGNGISEATRHNAMVVYKNGNTDLNGFTRLGEESENAPRIKMKALPIYYTGTNYNSFENVPHGLAVSQILSVSVLVEWAPDLWAPPEYAASLNIRYGYYVSASHIVIQNNTPSADCLICEKPIKILITYSD